MFELIVFFVLKSPMASTAFKMIFKLFLFVWDKVSGCSTDWHSSLDLPTSASFRVGMTRVHSGTWDDPQATPSWFSTSLLICPLQSFSEVLLGQRPTCPLVMAAISLLTVGIFNACLPGLTLVLETCGVYVALPITSFELSSQTSLLHPKLQRSLPPWELMLIYLFSSFFSTSIILSHRNKAHQRGRFVWLHKSGTFTRPYPPDLSPKKGLRTSQGAVTNEKYLCG